MEVLVLEREGGRVLSFFSECGHGCGGSNRSS